VSPWINLRVRPWRPPSTVGSNPGAGTTFFRRARLPRGVSHNGGPRHDCILIRYGELGLKSRRVRARFTARLRDFIIEVMKLADLDCVIENDGGHLYVYSSDLPAAAEVLTRVFGIVSVSPAARVDVTDLDGLAAAVAAYSLHVIEPGQSFAVRARRTGTHTFTSMDLGRVAGSAVMLAFDSSLRVDLTRPQVELEVEVRGKVAYIYDRRMPAVGGLPPGSQGRVLCPLREREDAVACWMLMRRGCAPVLVVPEGDGATEDEDLVGTVRRWYPMAQVRTLPVDEWSWPALFREMGRSRSLAVVSGARGPDVPGVPLDGEQVPVVFFPLVGLDEEAYARLEESVLAVRPR
jgi:thiamine biosynthesis protein ThiI